MMNLLVRRLAGAPVVAGACLLAAMPAHAQTEPYLGQVMCGAWNNYAPSGWMMMNGQLLPIAQNTGLFALLGTNYGGDGVVTFALPDLRGRVPMHFGQGVGLSPHPIGEKGGTESVTLTVSQLPAHNHAVAMPASDAVGTSKNPSGRVMAVAKGHPYAEPPGSSTMAATASGVTGSSAPVNKMQPFLALNCMIAVQGAWPQAN
jgi:microcystin-dependent protein